MSLYANQLPYSNDYPFEKLYAWELKGRSLWNKNTRKWIKDELNRGEAWRAREWLKKHDGKLMIMNDFSAFRMGIIIRDGIVNIYDTDGILKGMSLHEALEFMWRECAFIPIRALDSIDLAKNKWMHSTEWNMALENCGTTPLDEVYYEVCFNERSRKYYLKRDKERTAARNKYFKNFDAIWGK